MTNYLKRGCRPSRADSFTLVEVVFAIAIFAFVLVSILGLMAYSSQLQQQAYNYSRLSAVSGQMLAKLNSQSFGATAKAATNNTPYYFTYDGLPTNSVACYYQCNITNVSPSISTLTNLVQIQLNIRWPSPQLNNSNTIVTAILNYD